MPLRTVRRVLLSALTVVLFATACGSESPAADEATSQSAPTDASADDPTSGPDDENAAVESQASEAGDEPEQATAADASSEPARAEVVGSSIDATNSEGDAFPDPPVIPTGPLAPETADAVDRLLGQRLIDRQFDDETFAAIRELGDAEDVRVAWWLTDLLRVASNGDLSSTLAASLSKLTGVGFDPFLGPWGDSVDHLIAWDVPAPPDYLTYKRNIYTLVEPRWAPLFVEGDGIDWRLVSWGGVLIDDRPYDQTDEPCRCIPAADNPKTTDVAGGDEWLEEDTIVFGVEIDGEARAYPRSTMEVREMVNDTLGGRDFAMPYCTLCGSAQVFFTDEVPDGIARPIMRTSGLLSRSNKVMYDVETFSIFDTFRGQAVTGPLAEAGIELNQHSVITTTWGQWKAAHPDTTVLHIDEALGRPDSDLRNTRDADGPIFPIGDVDTRLPVQEDVLGLLTAEGKPIAFHVETALAALEAGDSISVEGINLAIDGGGLVAVADDGTDLGGHQAFWFAWSQFYPGTSLWPEDY